MKEKELYNLEEAQEEAVKMQAKVESGEVENYVEAEKVVEDEIMEKRIVLNEEQEKVYLLLLKNLHTNNIIKAFENHKELENLGVSPVKIILLPDAQEAIKQALKFSLTDLGRAIKIKNEFCLSREIFESTDIQEVIKEVIIYFLKCLRPDDAIITKNEFYLSKEKLESSDLQEAVKEAIDYLLKNNLYKPSFNFSSAKKLKNDFLIIDDKELDLKIQNNINELQNKQKQKIENINIGSLYFDFGHIQSSKEQLEKGIEVFKEYKKDGLLLDCDFQDAILELLVRSARMPNIIVATYPTGFDWLVNILNELEIARDEKFLEKIKLVAANLCYTLWTYKKSYGNHHTNEYDKVYKKILSIFQSKLFENIDIDEAREIAAKKVIENFSKDNNECQKKDRFNEDMPDFLKFPRIVTLLESKAFSDKTIHEDPFVGAFIKKTLIWFLEGNANPHDCVKNAIFIKEQLGLSNESLLEEDIQVAAKNGISRLISLEYIFGDHVLQIKDNFNLPDSLFKKAVEIGLLSLVERRLKEQYINHELLIKIGKMANNYLDNDFFEKVDVQSLGVMNIIKNITEHTPRMQEAQEINDLFHIKQDSLISHLELIINNKDWNKLLIAKDLSENTLQFYENFVVEQKRIAENINLPYLERQNSIKILSDLVEAGETHISQELSEIIQLRSKQKEVSDDNKWGFDPVQEASFYTLMRLDNPESNNALFSLLSNENVNETVKYAVLKKLSSSERNFLNENTKSILRGWLSDRKDGQNLDWRDMEFVFEILKISSTETRESSLQEINSIRGFEEKIFHDILLNDKSIRIKDEKYDGKSVSEFWQDYDDIPKNIFLQLVNFVNYDKNLLKKFNTLYSLNKKESTKKENLLYGVVNSQSCSRSMLNLLIDKLNRIDFGSKDDINSVSELLRQISFFDKIDHIKNFNYNEDGYYEEENYNENENVDFGRNETQQEDQELPQEILDIFSHKITDLDDLVVLLKEVISKKIQEILPNKNITGEKVEAIEKKWGNLEPIFTYLGRFPQLKKYIAEMVVQFDSRENWKNWRYNLKNKSVKNQIGHLSKEQVDIWSGDYFSEIGDIMIAESGSDKPFQIQIILRDAILTHKHIFNPEQGQNKNEYIQKTLDGVFAKISENPDKKESITKEATKTLSKETESINTIINFNSLPRLKQSLGSIIPENTEIENNKKVNDTVDFLMPYLPKELRKILDENCKNIGDKKKINSELLLTKETRLLLNEKIKEIEEDYNKILESDIWEKLNLDKNNLKNLGQFYQKRQELKVVSDLLNLNNLSNKLIAINTIMEKDGKKGGETITEVLDNLKKFFKDSPFLLDLKNIELAIREKIDFGEKRRLAMILTDNPQMLWQSGKYPLGSGSCQHYAEGSYANQLMGYVGDANCKVSFLVDLNKLSADSKKELNEKGFEAVKDNIPVQELLNASLARSIIKMTKDKDNNPIILLEPTYTSINKGDSSMDNYYNFFIDLIMAEPMKVRMARGGGGKRSIFKGDSRSPDGQYEDLNLSSVKFINKKSKPTKSDMEIMERIRSSR